MTALLPLFGIAVAIFLAAGALALVDETRCRPGGRRGVRPADPVKVAEFIASRDTTRRRA